MRSLLFVFPTACLHSVQTFFLPFFLVYLLLGPPVIRRDIVLSFPSALSLMIPLYSANRYFGDFRDEFFPGCFSPPCRVNTGTVAHVRCHFPPLICFSPLLHRDRRQAYRKLLSERWAPSVFCLQVQSTGDPFRNRRTGSLRRGRQGDRMHSRRECPVSCLPVFANWTSVHP